MFSTRIWQRGINYHSFIHSFIHSFTHSFIHPFIHSLTLTHPHITLTNLRTHSLTHSSTHLRTHSPTHSLTHSVTHSLTHSPTHSPTHSLTHSVTRPLSHYALTHPSTGKRPFLHSIPHKDDNFVTHEKHIRVKVLLTSSSFRGGGTTDAPTRFREQTVVQT